MTLVHVQPGQVRPAPDEEFRTPATVGAVACSSHHNVRLA